MKNNKATIIGSYHCCKLLHFSFDKIHTRYFTLHHASHGKSTTCYFNMVDGYKPHINYIL